MTCKVNSRHTRIGLLQVGVRHSQRLGVRHNICIRIIVECRHFVRSIISRSTIDTVRSYEVSRFILMSTTPTVIQVLSKEEVVVWPDRNECCDDRRPCFDGSHTFLHCLRYRTICIAEITISITILYILKGY